MSLTTAQITSAVRRKILEETEDLVSNSTITLNINLAYDDLKIKTFTNDQIKTATISFTAGVGILPAQFGTLYTDAYRSNTDTTPFPEKSIAEFVETPSENGVTIQEGAIKVSPDSVSSLIIRYFPSYEPLSEMQNPEINGYLHELIIYGAMYRTLEDMQNEGLAEYYKERYREMLNEKIGALSNYQESNLEGKMFNGINLI